MGVTRTTRAVASAIPRRARSTGETLPQRNPTSVAHRPNRGAGRGFVRANGLRDKRPFESGAWWGARTQTSQARDACRGHRTHNNRDSYHFGRRGTLPGPRMRFQHVLQLATNASYPGPARFPVKSPARGDPDVTLNGMPPRGARCTGFPTIDGGGNRREHGACT